MKPIERVKILIDEKRLSISAFEKAIGMSNNSIQTAIKRQSNLKDDTLNSILNTYTDISAEWLLTGKGEMLKKNKEYENNQKTSIVSEPLILNDENVSDYLINNWERMLKENKKFEVWYSYITMKAITDAHK